MENYRFRAKISPVHEVLFSVWDSEKWEWVKAVNNGVITRSTLAEAKHLAAYLNAKLAREKLTV